MNYFKVSSRLFALALSLFVVFVTNSALADDTEIFFSEAKTSVNPNVMFIIDVSGTMDIEVPDSGGKTRLKVMQDALKTVLDTAPENLNVGLMNYGEIQWYDEGHGVKFPITDIEALARPVVIEKIIADEWGNVPWWESSIPNTGETVTVREYLSEIADWYWKDNWKAHMIDGTSIKEMPHSGITPIVDALYEAALYFRGEKVTFGLGAPGFWARTEAHQSTYEGPPIQNMPDKCEVTESREHDEPLNFAANENDWYKCPADANNPTSPGSYANCQISENCTTTTAYGCLNVIKGYCSEKIHDEFGNYTCAPGKWVSDICVDNQYGDVTSTRCIYEQCEPGVSHQPNYRTPITQSCQSNFIVLLSDGKPEYSTGTTEPSQVYTRLKNGDFSPILDKANTTNQFNHIDCDTNPTPNGYRSGTCGPELTSFLSTADNSDLDGVQTIDTYAVGFGLGGEASATAYLKSLVSTDDPSTLDVEGYFSAEDEVQLSQAFSHILTKISSTTTSFASPGYSVDLKTGLFNEGFVYIPVFDKALTPRWSGNLKKFKLGTDSTGNNFILDKNDVAAVNNLGVFTEAAVDVWSTSSSGDGREVAKGGVAQLIDPNGRKAVTDIGCVNNVACELIVDARRIHPDNDASHGGVITSAVLGLDADETISTRVNMLNFIRGRKWNQETGVFDVFPHMGDMLHTEPLIVTYHQNPDLEHGQVIYAATNEGYLHAFDTDTGEELFAFMPSSLMKNIPVQYYNSRIGKHAYGIDGIMSKRVIPGDNGADRIIIYFGLRRGGREYYALDVTDATDPKLLWKIGADAETALSESTACLAIPIVDRNPNCRVEGILGKGDFKRLGQSWSTPYLAKIRTSDTDFRDVVIFSGGYDVNQDEEDQSIRENVDTVGNDIYIVDALSGSLLWSARSGGALGGAVASPGQLSHSIPGGMRILDMNQDGAIDRMYFADTKGRVWRLELPLGPNYNLSESKLIKFATLGGSNQHNRMFFNEPDVARLKKNGQQWLTISLGSGYRAHPANEVVQDRFYVLLDAAVTTKLTKNITGEGAFTALKHKNLKAVTLSGDQATTAINQGVLTDKTILDLVKEGETNPVAGWYVKMPKTGEKVLSTSITSEGNVMFTTLVPETGAAGATGDLCTAPLTQGRFYSFNILTAEAGSDLDASGTITDVDLMRVVTANEIPGKPQRVFNEPACTTTECTQRVDIRVGKRNEALTTYDASLLESVFWTNPQRK